jgi:peptidyl-prolyl cis-trans isomerase C
MKTRNVMRHFLAICCVLGAVAAPGFAQQAAKPQAPAAAAPKQATAPKTPEEGPNKIVLKVGSKNYTQGDMEFLISSLTPQMQQVVSRQGKKPLGEQYAVMSLLSQQAEKDHLDASSEFRQKMALQLLQGLAQMEYAKLGAEISVSPDEIKQYYDTHPADFDSAQVREVIIRKQPEGAGKDVPGLPAVEAKARVEEIRKALGAGTDPKQVSEKYSTENAVMIDAEPRSVSHGKLVPVLDKAAFELKDGEVSEPLETPQAIAFLQVVGHTHADLKEVSEEIENGIHEQKVEAAVQELKNKSSIWMDEEYFKGPAEAATGESPAPPQQ